MYISVSQTMVCNMWPGGASKIYQYSIFFNSEILEIKIDHHIPNM